MAKGKNQVTVPAPALPAPPAADGFADVEAFSSAEPEVRAPAPAGLAGPPDESAAEVDPKDAEIAALKAEIERLKGSPVPPGRYRVKLPDSVTAVVQCEPGEHPWDAFRRQMGIVSSTRTYEIVRVKDDEPLGLVKT